MSAAVEYGRALFLLSEETGSTEAIKEQAADVSKLLAKNEKYIKLLDTPALSKPEKLGLIDQAFGTLNKNLVNLIKILCEGHSVYLFPAVASAFSDEYDKSRGIERVEAVTAVGMTDEQIKAMKSKLSALTGKTIILKNTIDPSIIGGVKLRYSGIQLDSSIKTRLERFEHTLKSVVL